ncbi:ferritin-like domain-containing protein [Reyranella sp. CPCC 100927]|uniref:ferritin-like domain-containing protein n=1 Tax=Reyranella sp. CPCC 100927 TaxID=2599616 RepID=UPI0011B5D54F|nr:ferritin-like domain-containing protein [Reyranella sp. CPCC 100927]TWS97561.1 ferritin-like domain-containing protein [Reyranella sp. CPCC 100927]
MASEQITYDAAYDTVAPDDFPAMMAVPRYGRRSDAFDTIISQTHDHFWDPLDKAYIDFSAPFDIDRQLIMPEDQTLELQCAVIDKVPADQRIRFANDLTHFSLSSILHGEQGALSLSASLCHILLDPGAQEYAANQAREEARHVTGFTKYVAARWGEPLPVGPTLGNLLTELVTAHEVYKKIVGMQMLVEGLAMGAFATINAKTNDPTLRRLIQLVMSDEAFHHRFGRIWAQKTIKHLTKEEHRKVEDWTAQCFQVLLFNLINAEQKQLVYRKYNIDWQWARDALKEAFTDDDRRTRMQDNTNIFRVLIKTLLHAGIITDRTKPLYSVWVDMKELATESEEMPGDVVAEEMMVTLREINAKRRRIVSKDIAQPAVAAE